MKVLLVFDDTVEKSEVISDIIGNKGFADVVIKKRKLEEYYREYANEIFPDNTFIRINNKYEYSSVLSKIEDYKNADLRIIHIFSNYYVISKPEFELSLKKVEFIDEPYNLLCDKKRFGSAFNDSDSYIKYLNNEMNNEGNTISDTFDDFEVFGAMDIGVTEAFIQCITGNFESRFFNSLKGNDYYLVKSSENKEKIKAEYNYYGLLPENMKPWFVMPFDFEENDSYASYKMERLHMADLAIKWVHGSMDEDEFEQLMDKFFYFFSGRHSKLCTEAEFVNNMDSMFVDKVTKRIESFKKCEEYKDISRVLSSDIGCDIDTLLKKYISLKEKIESKSKIDCKLVIGHGDPCFSNVLYNKSTKTLKFIDPKGANSKEELWVNEYYDLAKLSHSVCGLYDFLNTGLYDVTIDDSFKLKLEIPFDNSKYVEIFKKKLEVNGFEYLRVRIYEASLFLSMLPLHIDNPHKVMSFVLNAKRIMEEIEKDV